MVCVCGGVLMSQNKLRRLKVPFTFYGCVTIECTMIDNLDELIVSMQMTVCHIVCQMIKSIVGAKNAENFIDDKNY